MGTIAKEIWPNFFIVGAMKAGTTFLFDILGQVEGIYMPDIKEPHYFASADIPESASRIVIRERSNYLSLFSKAIDAKAIGEASTNYLYSITAPYLIHKTIPHAKIIILLRDPIERAYSQYLMNVMNKDLGIHRLSFYEAITTDYNRTEKGIGISVLYVEKGLYYEQVKRYIDVFGRDNVIIMFFEEFLKDWQDHLKKTLSFLKVESEIPTITKANQNAFYLPPSSFGKAVVSSKKLNSIMKFVPESPIKTQLKNLVLGKSIPKPPVSSEAREFLRNVFQEDVNNLRKLLQRPLPWKNF